MAYQNQQVQEYNNLYVLLLYSGFDPQGVGFVDSNAVFSQMHPEVNQQVVNQVLVQNGVQTWR